MATKRARPGRTLITFFVGTLIAYGLVALTGTWTPALGLDLEGGTRLTLQAEGDPSSESLSEARSIIDQRVNGSGVTEAEVTTEGGNVITVEIPGESERDLIDTVARQAQLRFRVVACGEASTPCAPPGGADNQVQVPDGAAQPGAGATGGAGQGQGQGAGQGAGQGQGQGTGQGQAEPEASPAPRAPVGFGRSATTTPSPSATGTPAPSATAGTGTATPTPSASPTDSPTDGSIDQNSVASVEEALAVANGPSEEALAAYASYACTEDGVLVDAESGDPAEVVDDPLQPLVACSTPENNPGDAQDSPAAKYLLSPAVIEGTDLTSAEAAIPQGSIQWAVQLRIGGEGREAFSELSDILVRTDQQFAIVLDGQVISAPGFNGRITNGDAQIDGGFTETTSNQLATSLRFGALPISFADTSSELVGPSLAGDQLSAGLTAGAIGLALVMLYCLLYYRGLGAVVLASLAVAAAITYALVLLLSETAGFTLTLPGIAGLIIAVGITADSFIILFERIRDEMRDGKSMRVAVEAGWARARNTCLAADAVSLLAAVVLYIFAAGVVKGFAFALGLTTLVDLVVFFFFTKPMVSYLARYRFFNSGHKLSGLSKETLGIDAVPAGGKA